MSNIKVKKFVEKENMKNIEEIIMSSKDLAQNNMVEILKVYFNHYGFNLPDFENDKFKKDVYDFCSSKSVKEIAEGIKSKDKESLRLLNEMKEWFNFIMQADQSDINDYNENSSEEDKQGIFTMCLAYLLHINYVDRKTNVLKMLEYSIKSDIEIVKARAYTLGFLLLNPQVA